MKSTKRTLSMAALALVMVFGVTVWQPVVAPEPAAAEQPRFTDAVLVASGPAQTGPFGTTPPWELWQGSCTSADGRYSGTVQYWLHQLDPPFSYSTPGQDINLTWEVTLIRISTHDFRDGDREDRAYAIVDPWNYSGWNGAEHPRFGETMAFTPVTNGDHSFFPSENYPFKGSPSSKHHQKWWNDGTGEPYFGVDYVGLDFPGGKTFAEGGECGIYFAYGYPWSEAPVNRPRIDSIDDVLGGQTLSLSSSPAPSPSSSGNFTSPHEDVSTVGLTTEYFDNPDFSGQPVSRTIGVDGEGPAAVGCPEWAWCTIWDDPPFTPSGSSPGHFTWGVRMSGTITLSKASRIRSATTQRVRVHIDGNLYTDFDTSDDGDENYGDWTSGPYGSSQARLQPGTYDIVIEVLGSSSEPTGFYLTGVDGTFLRTEALQAAAPAGTTVPTIGATVACANGHSQGYVSLHRGSDGSGLWAVQTRSGDPEFSQGANWRLVANVDHVTIPNAASGQYGYAEGETVYARVYSYTTRSFSNTVRVTGTSCWARPPSRPTLAWQCTSTGSPRLDVSWPTTVAPDTNGYDVEVSTTPDFAQSYRATVGSSTHMVTAPDAFVDSLTGAAMGLMSFATTYYARLSSDAHQPSTSMAMASPNCNPTQPSAPTVAWDCTTGGDPTLAISWPSSTTPGSSGFQVQVSDDPAFGSYAWATVAGTTFATSAPEGFRNSATNRAMVGMTYGKTYHVRVVSDAHNPSTSAVTSSPAANCGPVDPGTDGLLGFWRADGTTSAFIGPDLVGSTSYAAGVGGQAFSLDQGQSLSAAVPEVSSGVTVAAWIRPEETGSSQAIAGRWANPPYSEQSYSLRVGPQGTLDWFTDETTSRFQVAVSASAPELFDGEYHHVAATWERSEVRLYVDGELVLATHSQGGTLNPATATPFRLGRKDGIGVPFQFIGEIDGVVLFDRALTEGEIAALLAGGG